MTPIFMSFSFQRNSPICTNESLSWRNWNKKPCNTFPPPFQGNGWIIQIIIHHVDRMNPVPVDMTWDILLFTTFFGLVWFTTSHFLCWVPSHHWGLHSPTIRYPTCAAKNAKLWAKRASCQCTPATWQGCHGRYRHPIEAPKWLKNDSKWQVIRLMEEIWLTSWGW